MAKIRGGHTTDGLTQRFCVNTISRISIVNGQKVKEFAINFPVIKRKKKKCWRPIGKAQADTMSHKRDTLKSPKRDTTSLVSVRRRPRFFVNEVGSRYTQQLDMVFIFLPNAASRFTLFRSPALSALATIRRLVLQINL